MPLSIDKLKGLLEKKGFICQKYFMIGGKCKYIEILSINTIDSYLLHIPDRYEFIPRTSDNSVVYKIKPIEIIKSENVEQKYAGRIAHEKLLDNYNEIELNSQYPHKIKNIDDINMEKQLNEQYRRPIILKDVEQEDNDVMLCIFRQLKRLQYCVQFLKYRFGIIHKDYLAILNSDDNVKCYKIKNYLESAQRDLYIMIDLEVFYENSKILNDDLEQLQNGIRGVLDKNQEVQTKHLYTMLDQQQKILGILSTLHDKKLTLRIDLEKIKELFSTVDNAVNEHIKKIEEINVLITQTTGKKQEQYIKYKHQTYMKLTQLYTKKEEIAHAIVDNRKYEHHLSLNIDRILFDNNVMLDKIFKNVSQLLVLDQ